ncbi:MAG: hypothetical protein KGL37_07780 [Acidobacteriota bacterium]|nr:hypothetical protein [Acidobacteriota bacterium]
MISHSIRPGSIGILAMAALLAAPVIASAQNHYPDLSQARIAAIAQMLPEKPAGFGMPCSDRAAWEPVAHIYQDDVQRAEEFIASPLPPWNDQAYLRYSRDGDRREGERMLGLHNGQLTPLVLAECSQWNGKFLPRIAEELDAISAEPSWTLPAHDPQLLNFHGTRYYVDLNAAALGHTVAETLYLLGGKIPEATRQRAMAALEKHMFGPMRRAYAGQEQTFIDWLHAKHNWNAVCLNGVTDAALTILPDRNERALFAAAGEHWVSNYLDSYSDYGYDTEGIGYWEYGFSNYEDLREQLWYSTGGKLDLFDNPKARKAALFGFQFAMLPGVYADFGDAHFMDKPSPSFLAAIDRIFNLGEFPDDLTMMRNARREALPIAVLAAFPNNDKRHDPGETAATILGIRTYYPEPGVLVDRPDAGGDFAITIKAGGNGNHSHNDIGSYSIGYKTTQIVGDPGGPGFYNADTFNNKRYTYRLLNSFGHPVPEVDGKLQLEATRVHPKVISSNFTPQEDTISMDITAAYNDPNLKQAVRTMHYSRQNGGSVELVDRFDVAGPADIVESFPTHGTCKQIDAKTIEIDYQGEKLQITIDAPAIFTITQDKVDDMGNPFTRIGAKMHLAKSGKVVMHFRPIPAS